MRKLDDHGSLMLPFVIVIVLLVSAVGFGLWAFTGLQNYKNDSDNKAAVAVAAAIKAEDAKKDAEFLEAEKKPYKTYSGPSTYGSVEFQYPRSWSAYISESASSSATFVNGYFSPNFVPDIQSDKSFALRVQIISENYTSSLVGFDSLIRQGTVKSAAYRASKVPSVLGSMLSGQIIGKKQGTMVLLPLRDKTLEIWTEGTDFSGDFINTVLSSLTFVP